MKLTLIAAHGLDMAIGKSGSIPWHYPEDLAHFKRETMDSTLIIGRKTFDAMGRALPRRRTIVITRQPDWQAPNVTVVTSAERALEEASADDRVFCAGGGEIYRMLMPYATHQTLTVIPVHTPNADAHYPAYGDEWVVDRERKTSDGLVYRWLSRP